jgi:hypothetical protein
MQDQQQMLVLEHGALTPRRFAQPVVENLGNIPCAGKKRIELHVEGSKNDG